MLQIFNIEAFDKNRHVRENFDCGVELLNNFLKRLLSQQETKRLCKTYVAIPNNSLDILGFYTLSAAGLLAKDLSEKIQKGLPKYSEYPVIRIGRLAVDRTVQKRGLGEQLLVHSLVKSFDITNHIGSIGVLVDAKDERARNFYLRYGFNSVLSSDLKLFIPNSVIKNLLAG